MKKLLMAVATSLAVFSCTPAMAQAPGECTNRITAVDHMAGLGMSLVWSGITSDGVLAELWANPENRLWFLVASNAEGQTCLAAKGDAFEVPRVEPAGIRS